MSSGAITRKQIIEDDAIRWGEEYVKSLSPAIEKNKEFVQTILALNEANQKLRGSSNSKEFNENLKTSNELGEKAITIWKEQIQLENNLISTKKKNELATESTNKALIKERTILSETNKEIKNQVRESLGLVTAYEKLNKSRNEAQKRLADLLSAEKKNVAQIVIAQLEYDKLDARVKAVDAVTKNYSKNIGNYSSAFKGLNETAKNLISTFGLLTGVALFGTILKDIFSVIRDFDRQLIAVGKTTNISGEALKQLGRDVVELADRLDGVSVDGLIKSAEVAGQLGVTGTANILKFSEAIEKLKLTSNIISDEQVGQFAKFIEVSSDSFDNADRLASVITKLGNEFATTESEVLANSTEIQKGIAVYETSAESVLALGAATSTLGSEAEASRSAIQSAFAVINNAIATGRNLQQVLKLTGLTQAELSKQFNKDAVGVFQKFIKGLADAKDQGQNLALVLNDVEITEKRAFTVIGALAANYGILEGSLSKASEEYKVNAALNKEVAAASESIASIVSDLKDKWEAYILTQNDVNNGTGALTKTLKFVRDNFKEIIDFVLKASAVFFTYLGVVKTVNFVIAASTALQTAWTAGQIRFALATGIGTKSILAQAEAAKAATVAQEGLNIATKATPWGLIIGLVSAAVVAYVAFNDTLSENEKRQKKVNDALASQKKLAEQSKKANEEYLASELKVIDDAFELKKAKSGDTKELYKDEIEAKKKVLQNYIDVNNMQIQANTKLLNETKKTSDEKIKVLQNEVDKFQAWRDQSTAVGAEMGLSDAKDALDRFKTQFEMGRNALIIDTNKFIELNKNAIKQLEELNKEAKLKDAKAQAELDKKAIEARKKRLKEIYDAEKKAADDLFKLQQFRLQVAINTDQEIIDNEKGLIDTRIEALLESNQLIKAKITEQAEYELKQLGKYNEDKGVFIRELSDLQIKELIRVGNSTLKLTSEQQLIYEKYQNALTEANKKGIEDRQKLVDNQANSILKGLDVGNSKLDKQANDEIAIENEKFAKILEITKNNYELTEQASENHERKLFEITQKYAKLKIQEQIKVYENILKSDDEAENGSKLSTEKRAEFELKLSNFKKELSEIDIETNKFLNEKKLEQNKAWSEEVDKIQKEQKQRTIELAQNLAYSLIELTNTIFDARIQAIDDEKEYWNSYYDEQIELAGNDARQKDLLEKEKAKKAKELEKERKKELVKAEIFNRAVKLAEIAMNLAVTISAINKAAAEMDFFAAYGFGVAGATYRAIQIPLAIGTAAIQTGTVLATPLPKYKTGRKDGPEEYAFVGDGYRHEVISNPDGSNPIITPAKPTVVKLEQHKMVHSSIDEYHKYLNTQILNDIYKEKGNLRNYQELIMQDDFYSKEILAEMKRNTQAVIRNKPKYTKSNNDIDLSYQLFRMSNIKWSK